MGACFNSTEFDGNLSENELKKAFSEHCREEEYENGHSAYNGTLATTSGLSIKHTVFASRTEAEDFVDKNTEKWGNALAVKYKVTEEIIKKEPTFNGHPKKNTQTIFDMQESKVIRLIQWKNIVFADQITEEQKEKVRTLYETYADLSKKQRDLTDERHKLVCKLQDLDQDFTDEDFKTLKKNRKELKKTILLHKKAKDKLATLDERLGKSLYKSETKETGIRWFVGGWCSE